MKVSDEGLCAGQIVGTEGAEGGLLGGGLGGGKSSGVGRKANLQSLGLAGSLQPVRMGPPVGAKTVTSVLVNRTVQSLSQIGPIPIRVCLKPGMMWPVMGKCWAIWGIGHLALAWESTV